MFLERPEWDIEGKYSADTVNMYFEHLNKNNKLSKVTKIETKTYTLSNALSLLR